MTTTDNYIAASSLTTYYPSRTSNSKARLWSVEKALHDLAALGIVDFFEGVGSDPTALTGYSEKKLWLKLPATGVTTTPGTVRRWNGSSPASSLSNWPEMSREQFYDYITQDLTGIPGGATWIDVKDYGVVGDASTDDLAAGQAIIDAATDGSLIYWPRSTYKLSGALKLGGTSNNKNKLVMIGDGDGTVLQLANAATTNVLEVTYGAGHRVSNMKLRGNKGTVSTPATDVSYRHYNGLYVGGHSGSAVTDFQAQGVVAENCAYVGFMIGSGPVELANIGDGVDGVQLIACRASGNTNGLAGGKQINCVYTGCTFKDNDVYGALTDKSSKNVTFSGNAFDNLSAGAVAFNLFIYNADTVAVTGNTFDGSKYDVVVDNGAENISITGNTMRSPVTGAIVIQNSRYVSIGSNTITGAGGIGIECKINVNRVNVVGNTIKQSTYEAIKFDSGYMLSAVANMIELSGRSGILMNSCSNCNATSNQIVSNGTSGAGYDGIKLTDSSSNVIQSNLITDLQGSKTQEYGIRSTGTSDSNVIQLNRLGGNLTGTYSLSGSSNLTDLNGDRVISGSLIVSGPITGTGLRSSSDTGGAASTTELTNVADVNANSTGVGTIKFKGATNRDSAGFAKIYIGTTAYYVPVFTAITG